MKTQTQFIFLKLTLAILFFVCCQTAFALDSSTPVIKSAVSSNQNTKNSSIDPTTTLIVHKPATDPAWGKLIQYHEEQSVSSTDKTPETLHKFLFQDPQGIIRFATFHENASGNGYWEVWVWDQP